MKQELTPTYSLVIAWKYWRVSKRLKSMKPETIKGIIKDMMATATDADCTEEIEEAVTDWL